jgi:hypothetical protein
MMAPMSRRSLYISSLLVVCLTPAGARAATPGIAQRTVIVSAERLLGLAAMHTSQDIPGGELNVNQVNQTRVGLTMSPSLENTNIYAVPRLALDLTPIDGLTLGGALGFAAGDSDASASMTAFLVAPRVGYVLGLSHVINLWLRAGLTYFNITNSNDPDTRSDTRWGMSLNIEPTLMIAPFDHVAFTGGLVLDLPVAGKRSTERRVGNITTTTSVGFLMRNIGLALGMVVSF